MDTVWVLEHGTCLNRNLIREIYGLARVDWSKPECRKHVPDAHTGTIQSVAWAPDGTKFVTASNDRSIGIWDPDGNQIRRVPNAHTNCIASVAWAPGGTKFVTVSAGKSFKIWMGS